MKLVARWAVSAALVLAATSAHAQQGLRYGRVSDFDGPYVPDAAMRYGRVLIPPQDVFAVLRETGFSPIGVPQLRGNVYVIAAVDRRGDDGRVIVDARTGQILNFMPADRMSDPYEGDAVYGAPPYGPRGAAPPPPPPMAIAPPGAPRPPAPIPHAANRATPMPPQRTAAVPPAPKPEPAPAPRQATVEPKPAPAVAATAPAPAPATPAPTVGEAKPELQIKPTQAMPQAQDLEY